MIHAKQLAQCLAIANSQSYLALAIIIDNPEFYFLLKQSGFRVL